MQNPLTAVALIRVGRHTAQMAVTVDRGREHTTRKRQQLVDYTLDHLALHQSVRGVVAIGSVATGLARADSDIDAVVFMEPLDLYLAPAESIWRPRDDTYHSIFADAPDLQTEGVQLDLHRLDLSTWRSQDHHWPEHLRSELADGWVAFDRTGEIEELIRGRTQMSEQQRLTILDQVLVEVARLLPQDCALTAAALGSDEAFDRLQAAYEALARGLFAYNYKWRPWRSRSLRSLLQLNYLPHVFRAETANAVRVRGDSTTAYNQRAVTLKEMLEMLLDRLRLDGRYGNDPVSEAFIRLHDEPGRAWNMGEWNRNRRRP